MVTGNNTAPETPRPLSPAMRQEIIKLDKTLNEYKLLCGNNIDSLQELVSFIDEKREQISALEKERQSIYNRNRHKKDDGLNKAAREISAKIKLLRNELSTAKAVLEKIPRFKELLETERQAETAVITKNKERRYARWQIQKSRPMPKFETSVELLDPMAAVQTESKVEEEKSVENSTDENAALLARLLSNPETAALLKALANTT